MKILRATVNVKKVGKIFNIFCEAKDIIFSEELTS